MTKLSTQQKQSITGGAIPIIAASAIKLVHGIITAVWVGLEVANLVADNVVKPTDKPIIEKPKSITIENSLLSSRVTIGS